MGNQILIDESLVGYIVEQLNQRREGLVLQSLAINEQIAEIEEKIKSITSQVNGFQENQDMQTGVRPAPRPGALCRMPAPEKPVTKALRSLLKLRTPDIINLLKRHGIKSAIEIADIIAIERGIKRGSAEYKKIKVNTAVMLSNAAKNHKIESAFDNDTKRLLFSV